MSQLFYRYNPWWEVPDFELKAFDRPKLMEKMIHSLTLREIVFLTGLRRIGKSTLLKLLIKHLISVLGVKPQNIFYISLDDYLLSKSNLLELTDEFRTLHGVKFSEKVYLFFDEVAYQKDYQQQLKNLYDSHNVKIYASSSQSSILRSDKAYITGRGKVIEVQPLDFPEYMNFKELQVKTEDQYLKDYYFEQYMRTGGIPEYVLRGDSEYLKELVDDILMKDIAAQHGVRDTILLKEFLLLLMEQAGKRYSITKLANILKLSPDTARRYLQYFEETYLIHLVPRYGKTNERLLAPKKIFAADIGIRTLFTGFRDKGSLFENYVYLLLKPREPAYLYENGLEIDFITKDKTIYEVKYQTEPEGKQLEFFNSLKYTNKYIIKNIDDISRYIKRQSSL